MNINPSCKNTALNITDPNLTERQQEYLSSWPSIQVPNIHQFNNTNTDRTKNPIPIQNKTSFRGSVLFIAIPVHNPPIRIHNKNEPTIAMCKRRAILYDCTIKSD